MPPSGRSGSLTREEIVAAALRLIKRHGLSRLTMRAVAAELDVTPMAVYHYIDDKEDLVQLVVDEITTSSAPLRLEEDGWEASLRRHLMAIWESLARYPGLSAYIIELPTLEVRPEDVAAGVRFFEDAGFSHTLARLAWSFALTYVHGRLSVDARLGHKPNAPRLDGLRAHDYLEFGVEAVIHGLRAMLESDTPVKAKARPHRAQRQKLRG